MHKFKFIGGRKPDLDKKGFIEKDYGTVRDLQPDATIS
jgi:hypothetical protein